VGSEPDDRPDFVAPLRAGRDYVPGTPLQDLAPTAARHSSGLWIPTSHRPTQPIDFVGTYVSLGQYSDIPPHVVFDIVGQAFPLEEIVLRLVAFNHEITRVRQTEEDLDWFIEHLAPPARSRILQAIGGQRRDRVYLVARQPILYALKRVMGARGRSRQETNLPLGFACLLMVHAAAEFLTPHAARSHVVFGNVPAGVLMDMVRGEVLSRERDAATQLADYYRLWHRFGDQIADPRLPEAPRTLFSKATGVDLGHFWALATAMYAFYLSRDAESLRGTFIPIHAANRRYS